MKAKPLKYDTSNVGSLMVPCDPADATHVELHCPGPYATRIIPVHREGQGGKGWEWNGDTEQPTLRPSILTTGDARMPRCHSYVTAGMIRFLSDCSHKLAGQTVELLDVE